MVRIQLGHKRGGMTIGGSAPHPKVVTSCVRSTSQEQLELQHNTIDHKVQKRSWQVYGNNYVPHTGWRTAVTLARPDLLTLETVPYLFERLSPTLSTRVYRNRPLALLLVQASIFCEKRIDHKLCETATSALKQRHKCLSEVEIVRDETWHPNVLHSASVILVSIYQLTWYRKDSRCHCSAAKLWVYHRSWDGLGTQCRKL
jgi:hypothetical protein